MDPIIQYYKSFDEWGRLDREPFEFMVNWHFIEQYLPQQGHILDNGAGPGKYAMKLAERGYKVACTDITPRLIDLAEEKAGELGLTEQFSCFAIADAIDLSRFGNGQFDASLMMGPLYHLQKEADRTAAIRELHRVTKEDGTVFVAFMPRTRHLITSILSPKHWKPNDSAVEIEKFMETGIFDHQDEGRFTGAYYYPVEEIQPFMERHGFKTLTMIGSSAISSLMNREQWEYWRMRGNDEVEKMISIFKKTAENPYLLGVSPHVLYIGKKIKQG